MLLITCPYCGACDLDEFSYGGEAHVARPAEPGKLSDAEWADYVFIRDNPKGAWRERWVHTAGCRRWFNVERDTLTNEIARVYLVGENAAGGAAKPKRQRTSRAKRRKDGAT